jgi:rfaE bifunctional protein nucleotidyltransferase chain/domain
MRTKVLPVPELKKLLSILRATGRTVVFTNGCFDILHTGHTRYLGRAKALGDILVVAVNSDASVRVIKGDKRPVNTESDRMEALAALEAVDFITLFSEPDPYRIIAELQPDVLVKGGDWPVDRIIGGDIVQARGGKVVNVPYIEGQSTTGLIEKILRIYK